MALCMTEFGNQFCENSEFYLIFHELFQKVDLLKYLGVFLNKNLDFDTLAGDISS